MAKIVIQPGQKFGLWTVIKEIDHRAAGYGGIGRYFQCRCACKTRTVSNIPMGSLRNGRSASCGCQRPKTHDLSRHPIYHVRRGMVRRCHDERNHAYENYGGRGITVCAEWRYQPEGIANFVAWNDSLPKSQRFRPGLTIERRDNDRGYGPDNCYWGTYIQQARNTYLTIRVPFRGVSTALNDVYDTLMEERRVAAGVTYRLVKQRYRKLGWSLHDVFSTPARA